MPNIHFVNSNKTIEVPENSSVLRMSLRYDGELPNRCGGGICGNCVFKIEEGAEYLDQVKPQERRKMDEELLEKGYRLGCQTFVTNGDIKISWEEEIRQQVVKRKPDKTKSKVSSVK
ncbi:(2Fe-2S)-binding protein [Bacillus sp. V3B]|uniref:2Fe-2S iron-sulfur cluster-binding protein n=1 Tax=Bacillus sp. V3B TaxID=2804915 RepID=UPI00210CAD57|nr:2Fe-2S iron-sulfur cluster-binding protein [Bacillus sp. V3B]MCQ6273680.1 (2Fe-2S)-binding protein [Bacillus sp. V3B]